jgi:hypothetical protein
LAERRGGAPIEGERDRGGCGERRNGNTTVIV